MILLLVFAGVLQVVLATNMQTSWRNEFITGALSSGGLVTFTGDINGNGITPNPYPGTWVAMPTQAQRLNTKAIYSNYNAIVILHNDGTIACFGSSIRGGTCPAAAASPVKTVVSTLFAFASLSQDGSVQSWGGQFQDAGAAPAAVVVPSDLTGITTLVGNINTFVAMKTDGTLVTWGYSGTALAPVVPPTGAFPTMVALQSTAYSHAILTSDGLVRSWGKYSTSFTTVAAISATPPAGLTGVTKLYSSSRDFCALKSDGTVVTWGSSNYTTSTQPAQFNAYQPPAGLNGVAHIASTREAFAALKTDRTVVAWGSSAYGGGSPSRFDRCASLVCHQQTFYCIESREGDYDVGHRCRHMLVPRCQLE